MIGTASDIDMEVFCTVQEYNAWKKTNYNKLIIDVKFAICDQSATHQSGMKILITYAERHEFEDPFEV